MYLKAPIDYWLVDDGAQNVRLFLASPQNAPFRPLLLPRNPRRDQINAFDRRAKDFALSHRAQTQGRHRYEQFQLAPVLVGHQSHFRVRGVAPRRVAAPAAHQSQGRNAVAQASGQRPSAWIRQIKAVIGARPLR